MLYQTFNFESTLKLTLGMKNSVLVVSFFWFRTKIKLKTDFTFHTHLVLKTVNPFELHGTTIKVIHLSEPLKHSITRIKIKFLFLLYLNSDSKDGIALEILIDHFSFWWLMLLNCHLWIVWMRMVLLICQNVRIRVRNWFMISISRSASTANVKSTRIFIRIAFCNTKFRGIRFQIVVRFFFLLFTIQQLSL